MLLGSRGPFPDPVTGPSVTPSTMPSVVPPGSQAPPHANSYHSVHLCNAPYTRGSTPSLQVRGPEDLGVGEPDAHSSRHHGRQRDKTSTACSPRGLMSRGRARHSRTSPHSLGPAHLQKCPRRCSGLEAGPPEQDSGPDRGQSTQDTLERAPLLGLPLDSALTVPLTLVTGGCTSSTDSRPLKAKPTPDPPSHPRRPGLCGKHGALGGCW